MDAAGFEAWRPRLLELCERMRATARERVRTARGAADGRELLQPLQQGAGDWSYGVDLATEDVLERWSEEVARSSPLSVLTEDRGWRHLGPGAGGVAEIDGFDHGGPRIAFDPIDGTRNLLADLRPAWTVVSFAPPGPGAPRMADLSAGLLAEIPGTRAGAWRLLWGLAGAAPRLEVRDLSSGKLIEERTLRADDDARADRGYFPFFRYDAVLRPAIAEVEASFFARLAEHEGADVRTCHDDQYICSAGQLALLIEGTYRMIVDLRAWLAARRGLRTTVTKPYDLAGAVVLARGAGCLVLDPGGRDLDFPIDAETPVSFVGWVNPATRARLEPHLREALGAVQPPG